MPNHQRIHYVIARNHLDAEPVIMGLKARGLKDVRYVVSHYTLLGADPKNTAIIFVPGWPDHGNAARIGPNADMLIHMGAIVKAFPQPKPEPEKKPEPDNSMQIKIGVKSRAEAAQMLAEIFGNRPTPKPKVDQDLTDATEAVKAAILKHRNGAAEKDQEITPTTPTDKYKQVFIGGPRHGQRNTYALSADYVTHVRQVLPMKIGAADVAVDVTYRRYDAAILGDLVPFWVDEREWTDRQRLVRDFLLFALEK